MNVWDGYSNFLNHIINTKKIYYKNNLCVFYKIILFKF